MVKRAPDYITPKGKHCTMLECKCDCGNTTIVQKYQIIKGITKSCGCLQKQVMLKRITKHGMYGTHIYIIWDDMIGRCYRKSSSRYDRYGGRGITVCNEWKKFESFYEYVSKLPHYGEQGYTINRIDNDGNYEPGNVEWSDKETQANNTSRNHYLTFNNKTRTIAQWSKETVICCSTIHSRIKRGW